MPQLMDEERLQAPSIEGADAHGSLRSALLTILDTQMPKEPEGNQPTPVLVLGIDAAWTAHNPSGVALVQRAAEGWQCLALAPSSEAFFALAAGQPWDQNRKAQGSEPDPAALPRRVGGDGWRGLPARPGLPHRRGGPRPARTNSVVQLSPCPSPQRETRALSGASSTNWRLYQLSSSSLSRRPRVSAWRATARQTV